jgi:hypothetical protein
MSEEDPDSPLFEDDGVGEMEGEVEEEEWDGEQEEEEKGEWEEEEGGGGEEWDEHDHDEDDEEAIIACGTTAGPFTMQLNRVRMHNTSLASTHTHTRPLSCPFWPTKTKNTTTR